MNIHLGVFVIPNQQSRVEVNDVNTVRDAGLVVPATRSEATPPPTPAAHDGTKLRFASWIAICPRAGCGGVAEWPAQPRTVPSSRVSRIAFMSFISTIAHVFV
jgi:hypothetical protein